jgi:hypothetical protein
LIIKNEYPWGLGSGRLPNKKTIPYARGYTLA